MTLRIAPKEGPANALLGACHSTQELGHAMAIGLDFAVLGPVKATASHPGTELLGWGRLPPHRRRRSIPVYAIGAAPGGPDDARRAARTAWP
jgi:8-oxo-dGTP diphosphatase